MSLTNTPQSKLLFEKMQYAQSKQQTASDNMARAGVAGAKAKEIEPFEKSLKRGGGSSSVVTTNAKHMQGKPEGNGFKVKTAKNQGEPTLTGNSISPEEQLLQLNEASTEFYRLEQVHKNEKERIRMISTIGGPK